jgi:Spy/CpxP family protein refolding chaperone
MKTRHDRFRRIALATLLLSLTWCVGAGIADPWGGRGAGRGRGGDGPRSDRFGGPPEQRIEMLAERLDLSTDQQARIEAIIEEKQPERAALRKQLMRLQHELRGLLLADEPELTAVTQLATRIGDARTKMQILRLEERLAIRGVLTAEQRDRFLTMQPRAGRGRGPGRAGGGAGCDGSGPGRQR